MKGDELDPKALIRESYNIDGITVEECRSIFVDWALGVPVGADQMAILRTLLDRYAPDNPDHPMTGILREGLQVPTKQGRRGGRRARVPH